MASRLPLSSMAGWCYEASLIARRSMGKPLICPTTTSSHPMTPSFFMCSTVLIGVYSSGHQNGHLRRVSAVGASGAAVIGCRGGEMRPGRRSKVCGWDWIPGIPVRRGIGPSISGQTHSSGLDYLRSTSLISNPTTPGT